MTLADYDSALVTGASSGIGAAATRALRARGIAVHAAARNRERLQRLADETGCEVHAVDVGDSAAVREAFGNLPVDILINNAGVGPGFDQGYNALPENIDAILKTNVLGSIQVIGAVAPGMVARGRGHIVNIGSVSSLHPMKSSVYGASKAALHMMSQNLRIELQGTGIRVSEVCPGQVATAFFDNAFEDREAEAGYMQGLEGMRILQADDVVAAILYTLDAPPHVNVSLVELTPTEQVPGGLSNVPVATPPVQDRD